MDIAEITTDLYYDLLDKYINLKCDMQKVLDENKAMRYQSHQFRVIAHNGGTTNGLINSTINEMKKISYRHKFDYKKAIEEMDSKKINVVNHQTSTDAL